MSRKRERVTWAGRIRWFSKPIMLITCWHFCIPVSQALWFAIRCHCLASRRSASSPLIFFMISSPALCLCFLFRSCPPTINHLWNQPCHAPMLTTMHRCGANFIVFLYKAWRKCAHIYIQMLAQNRTAVIKISWPLTECGRSCDYGVHGSDTPLENSGIIL